MLELHPKAIVAFNQIAESCLNLVKIIQSQTLVNPEFSPEFHPVYELTSDQIIRSDFWEYDVLGNKTSIYLDQERTTGIFEEDYIQVKEFLKSLFKNKNIRNKISLKTLENLFQKWAVEKFANRTEVDFISFLTHQCDTLIKPREIWIPIEFLSIEKEFNIGKILFLPIKQHTVDSIKKSTLSRFSNASNASALESFFEKKIRHIQGYTAAVFSIESELERAYELAVEEVKKSLSILRLFSPVMYEPRLSVSSGIWGSLHTDYANIISLDQGAMSNFKTHQLDSMPFPEKLDSALIDYHFQRGLSVLHELLIAEKLNQFQEKLLNCLLLFSRSLTAKDPSDKLIYILTSLESFFLRSSSEPIQQNLGERIAFLIRESPKDRKDVTTSTRKIYDLRSKFIHHGIPVEDYDVLTKFMRFATDTVFTLINCVHRFATVETLLDELETRKFS